MELTLPMLADTQRAFDQVAPTYDRANAENAIICAMRERTIAMLMARLAPGATLLDLGCGPGIDAVRLGHAGYRVTAIDSSPGMAQRTRGRVADEGLESRVRVQVVGIHELQRLGSERYAGAYSNLGPLNCVPDLGGAARGIADRLHPGGIFVASVIGRICPWEIVRYGAIGDWPRVRVRFARAFVGVPLEGRVVWTRYYSPAEFSEVFALAGFRQIALEALGLFVPPPYLHRFHARHPRLMRGLDRLERLTAGWPGLRQWGDHFLIAMVRT
jgi:SAM-dependent methyltransferase